MGARFIEVKRGRPKLRPDKRSQGQRHAGPTPPRVPRKSARGGARK